MSLLHHGRTKKLNSENCPRSLNHALTYLSVDDEHIDPSATVERVIESARDQRLKGMGARPIRDRWFEYEGWSALDVVAGASIGTSSRMAGQASGDACFPTDRPGISGLPDVEFQEILRKARTAQPLFGDGFDNVIHDLTHESAQQA